MSICQKRLSSCITLGDKLEPRIFHPDLYIMCHFFVQPARCIQPVFKFSWLNFLLYQTLSHPFRERTVIGLATT